MNKIKKIIAWIALVLLGIILVTDGLCNIGISRGWQYLYNAAYLLIAVPLLLGVALQDEIKTL